jgi:tRNA pseudouridine38-40 synthase
VFCPVTEYKSPVRHIRLVVEYDGTALCGWQRQANGPTVQGHLEAALGQLLAHDVAVVGASRTDAGVHARGQVASFRTERAIPLHGVRRGLNSLLPPAIAIAAAAEVPDDFHPRFSATGKHYRYLVLTRSERSPRWRDRAWHHRGALDLAAMRQAAAALIGEHDFAAFRAAGCTAKSTVRRIDEIVIGGGGVDEIMIGAGGVDEVMIGVGGVDPRDATRGGVNSPALPVNPPEGGHGKAPLSIDVRGNAFLRNMVRIVVGTLVEVGAGRRPVEQVAEILASRDRTRAGITAPPQGLELMSVRYDGRKMGPPHGVE